MQGGRRPDSGQATLGERPRQHVGAAVGPGAQQVVPAPGYGVQDRFGWHGLDLRGVQPAVGRGEPVQDDDLLTARVVAEVVARAAPGDRAAGGGDLHLPGLRVVDGQRPSYDVVEPVLVIVRLPGVRRSEPLPGSEGVCDRGYAFAAAVDEV